MFIYSVHRVFPEGLKKINCEIINIKMKIKYRTYDNKIYSLKYFEYQTDCRLKF